ncbi:MAG: DNA-directed RNA polymerase subunit alpha [Planctomycetes bacterium]|nr:DNA-directed RNA polymerase subunit alpha [Planctomycetota bacterium]
MRIRWRGFELPTQVEKEEADATATYAKFTAEPFERGFATTIGNSLRRVLLSSIQGAAVRAIRIDGANNEFTSLEGVIEDVTSIILNIKRLRLRLHSDEDVVIRLEKSSTGDVTAADITPHQDVEIINPDLVICTLSKDVRFVLEMEIGSGRGFVPANQQNIEESPVGTIAIDSIYSPVVRCAFKTTTARLGKRTDFERLELEIWTDGSVSPELALVEGTNILRKHLNPFVKYFEIGRELEGANASGLTVDGDAEKSRLLDKPISILELSVRSENALRVNNIKTVAELVQLEESEAASLSNLGKVSAKEIKKRLGDFGLSFGMKLVAEEVVSA